MGVFRTVGKVLVYPLVRPLKDISASTKGVKDTLAAAREFREQKVSDAKAVSTYLAGKNAQEKFSEVYAINEWSERELGTQLTAARRTRAGMLVVAVFGMVLLMIFMWSVPVWAMAALGPIGIAFTAACCVSAARYAWWEAQIQERALFPLTEFMARRDLFRRVLWK